MKGIEGRHGHDLPPMECSQQPDDITVTIRLGALDQRMNEEDGGIEIVHSAGPGLKASLPELWVSGHALGSQNAFQALAAHLMERRLKRLIAEKFAESLCAYISHVQHSSRTHGRWQKRFAGREIPFNLWRVLSPSHRGTCCSSNATGHQLARVSPSQPR